MSEDLNRPPSPTRDNAKHRRTSHGPKAVRYWPGKAPEYAKDTQSNSEYDSDDGSDVAQTALEQDPRYSRYTNSTGMNCTPEDILIVTDSVDDNQRSGRRRAPAATILVEREVDRDIDEGTARHDTDVATEPDEIAATRDRSAIRSRAMAYRKEEESKIDENDTVLNSLEEEEELSESDIDNDMDRSYDQSDNEESSSALARPVFVPKKRRLTVLEKQQIEREEQRKLECERQRAIERQKQSKDLLIQTLVSEVAHQDTENNAEMIDDTDELNEKEYELWKIRELKRVIRDRDERTAHERLAAEVERRRHMTEDERLLDDERIDREKVQRAPRSKMKFLQKYYHKGAFFMDKLEDGSEPLYNRDFNAPTADDCVDKSLMPKPLQVRRGLYGKMGQVKHTHLTAEDTTRFDMPWNKATNKFTPAGTHNTFDRPSRKSNKKK
ncbi:Microfibrillar-associated protein 1 [Babesia sp. Xinjiang]|uniref:Microfibrillar-associated protein 1 n=1 Tax=Babesia sp. Xinjiang TaxID=462227 RepID=UPI000A244C1E|nr:Microfibrillar-associated protein 1 [Babesia sp. Xinjiang]ORM41420.1 Microfibrillar-associated protein 1 [Babesia sp. Xinjiang]